jgi:hypothetical protein
MITTRERVLAHLRRLPEDEVRQIVKQWAVTAVHAQQSLRDAIIADGFEAVDVSEGAQFIGDGDDMRPVIWVRGEAYALPADEHRRRRDEAIHAAKEVKANTDETRSVVGTESLSVMTCPKCGDNLQHATVCPKCSAGHRGYTHRYTCVCGAIEIISQEAL